MISLNTTIYEGNFDSVLDENSWFLNYKSDIVKEKVLLINNISSKDRLKEKLDKARECQVIDSIIIDDHKEEAKEFFKLDLNEQTLGYHYTIQYFVSFLKCKQPFIFNVSSDCILHFEDDYLHDSISELSKNENAITTTLPWSSTSNVGKEEQDRIGILKYEELEKFYYSPYFSDQVFVVDINKIKKANFNTNHPGTDFFPTYGGNCFEKRLCSYFFTEQKYRLIYKKYHYIHNQ